MKSLDPDEVIFIITREEIQQQAVERIGRRLTDDEIHVVQKGLQSGLLFDIDSVFDAVFEESELS